MNDEEAAEHIQAFDNNGNGKIEFGGMSPTHCVSI